MNNDPGDILPSQHYYRCSETTPVQRLAFALLQNGIQAARGVFSESNMRRHTKMRAVMQAQEWLKDPRCSVFSVTWCCDTLGIEPDALRAGLKRMEGPLPLLNNVSSMERRTRPTAKRIRVRA